MIHVEVFQPLRFLHAISDIFFSYFLLFKGPHFIIRARLIHALYYMYLFTLFFSYNKIPPLTICMTS